MASTDYDYSLTRTQISEMALRALNALPDGESMTGNQQTDAAQMLNIIVKSWQNEGIYLWTTKWSSEYTWAADTESVNVSDVISDANLLMIDKAFYRTTSGGEDQELIIKPFAEYASIQDKDNEGDPNYIFHNEQEGKLYLWPVPTAARYIVLLGIHKLKDWDATTSTGDVPTDGLLALMYQLAVDLAPSYGASVEKINWLQKRASYLFKKFKSAHYERDDSRFMDGAF